MNRCKTCGKEYSNNPSGVYTISDNELVYCPICIKNFIDKTLIPSVVVSEPVFIDG